MKRMTFFVLVFSFFLCSCSQKQSDTKLEFPGTSWGMGMREVQDALDLDAEDIGYTYVSDACISSMFHMEGYELFGAKTKSIEFHFLDLDHARQKKEGQKDDTEGRELFGKKQYGRNDQLLEVFPFLLHVFFPLFLVLVFLPILSQHPIDILYKYHLHM